MSNTWDSVLTALAPTHRWKFDEAAGLFLDSGSAASIDLAEPGAGALWREAPSGSIRGTPRVNGFWGSQASDCIASAATAATATGWLTGVFGAVVHVYSLSTDIILPITMGYNNTAADWIGLRIFTNGAMEIRCQTAADFNNGQTGAGFIVPGNSYFILGIQRNDGAGMLLFSDGVDVTNSQSQGGAGVLNDWADGILGGLAATDTDVGGLHGVAQGGAIITEPFVFVNSVLTDVQILSLFTAINGYNQTPSDYYEKVFDLGGLDLRYWIPQYISAGGSLRTIGYGIDLDDTDQPITGGLQTGPSAMNVAESGGVGSQIISAFSGFKSHYDSNDPTIADSASPINVDLADSIGTVNIIVTISGAGVGLTKTIFAIGDGVGGDNFEFGVVGSGLGYSVKLRVEATSGDFFQAIGDSFGIPTRFTMLTITQDGTGVKMFINGSSESFTPSQSGVSLDDTSWLADIVALTAERLGLGGNVGSQGIDNFEPNDLHDLQVIRRVLSATEVSELWDAVNGLFGGGPNAGAPAGGFYDTLNGLGNGGQGPDHWWRLNAIAEPIDDIGLKEMTSPNGDSIDTGGDPDFEVTGPLVQDPTNEAINFDGQGDYFEIGVDGITGELVAAGIGSVGFFVSRNDLAAMIAYSQANDLATGVWRLGLNASQQVELLVQSSTGNSVTLTSSVIQDDLEFHFIVLTNDGANYTLYIDNVVDVSTSIAILGTGAEGDWFDAFTADNSAVAALASSGFLTDTNGRFSEIFIYEEVLTASQVNALWEAALANGLGSSATSVGVLVFEDVTFLNGARADIRLSNSLTTFNQVLQVNRSRFIGGLEGVDAESISLTGEARASVRGCTFDLNTAPTTGRAAILATTADPTAGAATYGNLIVSDCTFNRMGHGDVEVHPAVFAESGFGMTVEKNRFLDSYVGAIGWRGDARRIVVAHNLIDGVTNGAAAVSCQVGLNTNIGNAWLVQRNTIIDVLVGNGISIAGANSSAAQFARDIQIIGNNLQSVVQDGIIVTQIADLVAYGNRIGGAVVEGISIGEILGVVKIQRNFIEGNTAEGIVMNEAVTQIATLIIDRNTVNAALVGDGMLFDGIDELVITNNKFLNLVNGLSLGDIGSSARFFGNQFESVSVPLAFVAATTQTGLEIGQNQLTNLGVEELTVAAEAISVFAQDHTITLAAPANLATINGFETVEGYVMILRLAVGSSNVTVVDTGNINLDAATDFIMDTAGESQIWLVSDGAGSWNELSRALGS